METYNPFTKEGPGVMILFTFNKYNQENIESEEDVEDIEDLNEFYTYVLSLGIHRARETEERVYIEVDKDLRTLKEDFKWQQSVV